MKKKKKCLRTYLFCRKIPVVTVSFYAVEINSHFDSVTIKKLFTISIEDSHFYSRNCFPYMPFEYHIFLIYTKISFHEAIFFSIKKCDLKVLQ